MGSYWLFDKGLTRKSWLPQRISETSNSFSCSKHVMGLRYIFKDFKSHKKRDFFFFLLCTISLVISIIDEIAKHDFICH